MFFSTGEHQAAIHTSSASRAAPAALMTHLPHAIVMYGSIATISYEVTRMTRLGLKHLTLLLLTMPATIFYVTQFNSITLDGL